MKSWNKIALGAVLMAVMALSGCGSRNGGQDSDGQGGSENRAVVYGSENPTEDFYVVQTQKLAFPRTERGARGWRDGSLLAGDSIYSFYRPITGLDTTLQWYHISAQNIFTDTVLTGAYPVMNTQEAAVRLPLMGELGEYKEIQSDFFADGNGMPYMLTYAPGGGHWLYYLYQCDAQGKVTRQWELTETLADFVPPTMITADYLFAYYGAVDGAGTVCLTYKEAEQLWLIDGDGQLVDTVPLEGRQVTALASGTDGSIYGADSAGSLFTVNAGEGSLEEVMCVPGSQGDIRLAAVEGGKLLCGDKLALYLCDPATGTAELLASWKDVGISGPNVCAVSILSDGRLLTLDDDGMLFCLTKVDATQLPARRQKVVLGVLTANDSLKNLVTEFNQRNYYYEVEIKEYGWENGSQLIDSAVVAGKGPDMVSVDAIYVDKYVKKGLLEDMSHYLEDGHGLEREDLVESVLRCYTVDGVLICIPASFMIDTLMGRASLLGEEPGWTIEEYLDFIQKNRGKEVAEGQWFSRTAGDSRTIIPLLVLEGDINAFVDWDANQAEFGGEDFSNLLRLAAGYESNTRYIVDSSSQRPGALNRMREGNILLNNNHIYSVDDYLNRQAAMGGDTVYIGYPTLDGRNCSGVLSSKAYVILEDSAAKDGAWAFQEFLLTAKKNGNNSDDWENWSDDFPVMRRALDYLLEQSMCKAYATNEYGDFLRDEEGNPIEIPISKQGEWDVYAATPEEVEQLRSLIDSLSFALTWQGNEIFNIVYDELDICMSGDRSVEETINIIQNRVQLYLDEN